MRLRRSQAWLMHLTSLTFCMFTLLAFSSIQVPSIFAGSPSFVRVIHASPFVGTADVFVDGTKLLSSFAFGTVTDYVAIPPGPHKVQIALVGKGIGASALTQTLTVTPGVAYTVAAIGATATTLSLQIFVDSNLVTPGTAKLRIYHLSPDAGLISVDTNGNSLVPQIAYEQASKYLQLSAGSYTFDVNTTNASMMLPLSITLKANTVASIFTVGLLSGNPKLELVPAQTSGLPSLPGTGSDPNALPTSNSQPLTTWMFGAFALLMLGAGVMVRRRVSAR
jgi:MYXO-CTERM domain-containing protein